MEIRSHGGLVLLQNPGYSCRDAKQRTIDGAGNRKAGNILTRSAAVKRRVMV